MQRTFTDIFPHVVQVGGTLTHTHGTLTQQKLHGGDQNETGT